MFMQMEKNNHQHKIAKYIAHVRLFDNKIIPTINKTTEARASNMRSNGRFSHLIFSSLFIPIYWLIKHMYRLENRERGSKDIELSICC